MKPSKTLLGLLPGALSLTVLRTDLEGEAARAFDERANECQSLDELIALIGGLPDQRPDCAKPSRIGLTELFIESSCLSINLKTIGLGCEVQLRIRRIAQTISPDAVCVIQFDEHSRPTEYNRNMKETSRELDTFVCNATKRGHALTAEAALNWLERFGAVPGKPLPKETGAKKIEFATATV